jgi:hypothetical protein
VRPPLVLGVAGALVGVVAGADAASLTLTDGDVGRALAVGQRSVASDAAFDAEWRVTNAAGESVTVMTPFHRLVIAARHAAFKNEALKPSEPERILKGQKDRLSLWVQLRGSREDFARHYAPRLILPDDGQGQREIPPVFIQNERTALRQDGGRFIARCVYGFPTKEITGTSRMVLVVRDADRRDVSRFAIDLSAMR